MPLSFEVVAAGLRGDLPALRGRIQRPYTRLTRKNAANNTAEKAEAPSSAALPDGTTSQTKRLTSGAQDVHYRIGERVRPPALRGGGGAGGRREDGTRIPRAAMMRAKIVLHAGGTDGG